MAGWVALEKMVMLVLLMLVGFAAAKAQWVDSAFSKKTSRLVANVFIVATILSSVVGVQPLLTGGEMAVVVAAVFVLFAIAGVLGWVCARLLPPAGGAVPGPAGPVGAGPLSRRPPGHRGGDHRVMPGAVPRGNVR